MTRPAGIACLVIAALGIYLLLGGDDCRYLSELFAQMRRCGAQYANEVRQMRVVPMSLFVGLFGAGILLLSR